MWCAFLPCVYTRVCSSLPFPHSHPLSLSLALTHTLSLFPTHPLPPLRCCPPNTPAPLFPTHPLPSSLTHTHTLPLPDVVLPGQVVSLARLVDVEMGLCYATGYFVPTLIAYALGLLATYTALYYEVGGTEGQPALLYLVPATLGTMLVLAAWRGHLGVLWRAELGGEGGGEGGEVGRRLLEEEGGERGGV